MIRASHHLRLAQLRRNLVQTFGEAWQVARWYSRKEVMFDMEEHIEGERILDSSAQRSRTVRVSRTVMMDCPDGKKRSEALSYQHRCIVVSQTS